MIKIKPKNLFDYIAHLKYFDNFDIIGIQLATFLRQKYNYLQMFLVKFVEINNMFLLIIENEPQNYYQIIAYNSDNILTFKYLIDIVKIKLLKDKNSLNNFIYNALLKKGIEPLFSKGNPISLENDKIVFSLYDFTREYINFDDESSISSTYSGIQRKNLVKIIFETTAQKRKFIEIDENKNIEELIKLYFKIINKPELFLDPSIRFLCNGYMLNPHSKDLIKSFINHKNNVNVIIVDDLEDKINKI